MKNKEGLISSVFNKEGLMTQKKDAPMAIASLKGLGKHIHASIAHGFMKYSETRVCIAIYSISIQNT
jgi:hypothetical protein